MQISIDLELPELETVLADLLPAGIELRSLRLDRQQLRAGLQAPMVGACTLTAQVSQAGAGLILSRFDLEGAGLAKPLALGALRRKLAIWKCVAAICASTLALLAPVHPGRAPLPPSLASSMY